jgi:hypothetical protein
MIEKAASDKWALEFAAIESHYFVNGVSFYFKLILEGFFETDSWILDNTEIIKVCECEDNSRTFPLLSYKVDMTLCVLSLQPTS